MTGRNIVFALPAVLLLAGFGYWMLAPKGPAVADDEFAHRPAASPDPGGSGEAGPRVSDTRPIETSLYTGQDEPDLDREPAAAEDALRFVLVQDPSGKPVPGAEVALVPVDRNRGRGNYWSPPGGAERRTPFRTLRSGPDGFALLSPLPARRFQIEARTDGTYGSADFDQGAPADPESPGAAVRPDAVVTIEPVKRLLVRVADRGGAPVPELLVRAMPDRPGEDSPQLISTGDARAEVVQFSARLDGLRGTRGRGNVLQFRNAFHSEWTSDPDGYAIFEINNSSGLYEAERVRVDAVLPGRDPVTQVVPMASTGTTEVAIEVPQTVRLAVTLVEPGGAAFSSGATVYWTIHSTEPAAGRGGLQAGFAGMNRSNTGSRHVTGGAATFSGFPANTRVTFVVRAPSRTESSREFALGPDLSQTVELEVGDLVPTISVALVDVMNVPLRNTEVQVVLSWEDDPAGAAGRPGGNRRPGRNIRTVTTNSNGEIRLDGRTRVPGMLQILPPGGAFRAFAAMARRTGQPGGPPPRTETDPMAQIAFAALQGGERRDLGTLAIDDSFILVSGQVIDHEGSPVQNADVAVQIAPGASPGAGGIVFDGFRNAITVKSDSQGAFRVFGNRDPSLDYAVSASTNRARSKTMSFSPGTRGLVLGLYLTGSLRGRIRQADAGAGGRLSVWLAPAGADPGAQRQNVPLRQDGQFLARNLDPGIYELTVQINGHTDATVTGIEIRGGETAAPAILADFIAGRSMAPALVTVSDPFGAPVHRALVEFMSVERSSDPGRGRNAISARTDERGHAEMLIPANQTVRLRIRSSDYRTFEAETASFPFSATLTPSPKIVVEFPPLPAIEGVNRYSISLMPLAAEGGSERTRNGRGGRNPRRDTSARPGETSATFTNVEAGTYAIRVFAEVTRSGGTIRSLELASDGSGVFFSGNRVGPIEVGSIEWADQRDQTVPVRIDLYSAVQTLLNSAQSSSGR